MTYLTSRPTRAANPTSPVVLQEFPCPTLPQQSSYKSCQPNPTSPVVLQEFPCPTLLYQLFYKCSHMVHYLTSCPTRVPTSYATSPAVLQVFPHPTLLHQSSYKSSHVLHYLTSRPTRVPTSYTTSPVVPQELTGCDPKRFCELKNCCVCVCDNLILNVNLEVYTHLHGLQTFPACMQPLHWATLCNILARRACSPHIGLLCVTS